MPGDNKKIPLSLSLIPFVIMIGTMMTTIIFFKGAPQIPLAIGAVAAGLVAWFCGYAWEEIEQAIYEGIRQVLPALVILMLLGLLISSWVAGGLVSVMIYYGLKLLSPDYFLPALMLICAAITLMTGSSWSTIGTLGVAGLATGTSMGLSPAPIVGAIVSGAYFGDKMSPLSDTTVLASGISNVNIFEHIRHMLYTTVPGLVIALVAFSILTGHVGEGGGKVDQIAAVSHTLSSAYVVSPWLLLIPLIVPVLAIGKVPAIPALIAAIVCGAASYLWIQGGSVEHLFNILQSGYTADTNSSAVNKLLNQGGLSSTMYTMSLTTIAMCFGGIMEHTGMLDQIVRLVLRIANTGRKLCAATVVSSFMTNIVTAEQYISIIIPGRMYVRAFRDKKLHPKNLSRALEDGGTVTSALVPWSTGAVFIYSVLGVSAWTYALYAVFNYSVPLISIASSLAGIAIASRGNYSEPTQPHTSAQQNRELATSTDTS